MSKIIVFGNSASGKSTLAKQLAKEKEVSHLDLDTIAWLPTVPPSRKPFVESKQNIVAFFAANQSWVIEGCYAELLAYVAPFANQAIFMNLPVNLCQQNAQKRPWEPHKYQSKAEQDANLPMLLRWIAEYQTRKDEFSYQAHAKLYNTFSKNKKQITTNQP